jgi:hypothetical protein
MLMHASSPTLQATNFYLSHFLTQDVEQLVTALVDDRPGVILEFPPSYLAAQIMHQTAGHRGLVGLCLSYVDLYLMRSGEPVTEHALAALISQMPFLMTACGVQVMPVSPCCFIAPHCTLD